MAAVQCETLPANQDIVGNSICSPAKAGSADANSSKTPLLKGTDPRAHKILHYGSRHIIQNTGWTTRLSIDVPTKKYGAFKNVGKTLPPLMPRMPVISVNRPTVVRLQSAPSATEMNSVTLRLIGNDSSAVSIPVMSVRPRAAAPVANFVTPSGVSISPQLGSFLVAPLQSVIPAGMPAAVNTLVNVRPTAVCFVPVTTKVDSSLKTCATSSIMSNSMCKFSSPSSFVTLEPTFTKNVTSSDIENCKTLMSESVSIAALPQDSSKNVSGGALAPPYNFAVKQLKTVAVLPVRGTGGSSSSHQDLRILNTMVRIACGHITEVNEIQNENLTNLSCSVAVIDNVAVPKPNQMQLDHIDINGANFGYHDSADGHRIRVARDTSGQRHSPYFLFPSRPYNTGMQIDECLVEIKTHDPFKQEETIPEEADVSAVTNVFTFEPLFVSENTLVPVNGKKVIPPTVLSDNQMLNDDEQYFAYRCYLCKYASLDPVKISRHWVNVHLSDLPYRCPYCERTFFTSTRAQVHVQRQHGEKGLTVVAFRRSSHFANSLSYELEPDDDTPVGGDSDEEATVTLERFRQLNTGLESVFACRKCSYQTKNPSELRQHLKFVHVRYKPYFCQYCTGLPTRPSFACDFDLKQHIRTCHPERIGTGKTTASASNVLPRREGPMVQAEIQWSESWEELTVGGEQWLQCRRCAFRTTTAPEMWPHVLREHRWPVTAVCPACSEVLTLSDDDRQSGVLSCDSCNMLVVLGPMPAGTSQLPVTDVIYVCNICAYKTQGRGCMNRHIKYNHTKCRPYACVYCNYVAVERPKVKMHMAAHHPNMPLVIKERSDANEQFRYVINSLFTKLVSTHPASGPSTADENILDNTANPVSTTEDDVDTKPETTSPMSQPDQIDVKPAVDSLETPLFACEGCNFETPNFQNLIQHQRRYHRSTLAANSAMVPVARDQSFMTSGPVTIPVGYEHFKCKICGYCCTDRSCMSRHVKYMHITARPHSCPYCSYNNVEKTKVRLHVRSHHPSQQKSVRTDHRLLEEMSWHAKWYYTRIDQNGQEVNEFTKQTNMSPDSPDDELPDEFTLDELSPHHDILDIQPSDDGAAATVVTSTGVYCIGMKQDIETVKDEADDDDVDLNIKSQNESYRSNQLTRLAPTGDTDHNYFSSTCELNGSAVDQAARSGHPELTDIKDEPIDAGYGDSKAETNKLKVRSDDGESVGPSVSMIGESAFNHDSSNDISDSDMDDFFDSDMSDDMDSDFSEASDQIYGFDIEQPPAKRFKIDTQMLIDNKPPSCLDGIVVAENVRNDPKIQMKPVVELEDVLEIILAWQQNCENP